MKPAGIVKRPQYYVFQMLAEAFGRCSEYIESRTECETYALEEVIDTSNRLPEPKFELNAKSSRRTVETPYLDCVAAMNPEGTKLTLSILNKHPQKDCRLQIRLFGREADWETVACSTLYHADLPAANTEIEPENVKPEKEELRLSNGAFLAKRHSLNVLTLELTSKG